MSLAKRALQVVAVFSAGLLALLLILTFSHRPNTQLAPEYAGKHVVVRGVPLRVHEAGSGLPVLLIHGSTGSLDDFAPLFDRLATTHRVIAFDRPGHGFSGDDGDYTYEHNAEMALALLDALGVNQTLVVGHSYGGAIALLMAAHAHKRVAGLVVLDSATYRGSRSATPQLRAVGAPLLGLGLARLTPTASIQAQLREALPKEFRVSKPSRQWVEQRASLWSAPKVIHALAVETVSATEQLRSVQKRYPTIRTPVHIVAQAEDAFRRDQAARLHRDVKGSTLTLLPHAGHFVHHEQTQAVLSVIERAAQQASLRD